MANFMSEHVVSRTNNEILGDDSTERSECSWLPRRSGKGQYTTEVVKRNYENVEFTVRLIGIGLLHGVKVGVQHETIPRVRNERGLRDKLDAPRRIVCIQLRNLTINIVLRHRRIGSVVERQDIKTEADGLDGGG